MHTPPTTSLCSDTYAIAIKPDDQTKWIVLFSSKYIILSFFSMSLSAFRNTSLLTLTYDSSSLNVHSSLRFPFISFVNALKIYEWIFFWLLGPYKTSSTYSTSPSSLIFWIFWAVPFVLLSLSSFLLLWFLLSSEPISSIILGFFDVLFFLWNYSVSPIAFLIASFSSLSRAFSSLYRQKAANLKASTQSTISTS